MAMTPMITKPRGPILSRAILDLVVREVVSNFSSNKEGLSSNFLVEDLEDFRFRYICNFVVIRTIIFRSHPHFVLLHCNSNRNNDIIEILRGGEFILFSVPRYSLLLMIFFLTSGHL